MADLSYDSFQRALKQGDPAPVYHLVGEEDVLKEEATRLVLDRVLDPSLRDFNYDQRSAPALDPEALVSLLDTLPMMADRRVVVLRDVDGWQKRSRGRTALLKYLEKPSPDTVLLMVQGAGEPDADKELAARAVVVRCDPLPADRAARWVVHEGARQNFTITPEAAGHLVDAVGANLSVLRAELAKLASLPQGTEVTVALIGDLVGVRHGETVIDWRNAVMDDDTARAAMLLGPVLAQSGITGVRLIMQLGPALIGATLARAELERGARGARLESACFQAMLKLRPFGLGDWKVESKHWARWAERWPDDRLRAAFAATLAADQALKSTTLRDEHTVLLDLVLELAATRRTMAA
ncbi:MAG TPA: DNA polymerase III subunit delta [Gemmatimonadales bacterium]|nr:DNA polymerase III subunit delta [Gemmatimonadales bacterium]